jgi:acyl carrier protein
MKGNTIEALINDIAIILKVSPDRLNKNSSIGSIPEWDSFSHIEIMLYLEEKYDLLIDEHSIEKLVKIKNILREIESFKN